eukprot:2648153-Amphidinium_carterae.2
MVLGTERGSCEGYERLVLPATLGRAERAAMRSLAKAANLSCSVVGTRAGRQVALAQLAECPCCPNTLQFPASKELTPADLRDALITVFGISPLSDVDIT